MKSEAEDGEHISDDDTDGELKDVSPQQCHFPLFLSFSYDGRNNCGNVALLPMNMCAHIIG